MFRGGWVASFLSICFPPRVVTVYLCGEAAMEFYMAEQQASVFSWASEMGAAVITLEHRSVA